MPTCLVCQESAVEVFFTKCKHASYCESCVQKWLVTQPNPTCPECRSELTPDQQGLIYDKVFIGGYDDETPTQEDLDKELKIRQTQLHAEEKKLRQLRQEVRQLGQKKQNLSTDSPRKRLQTTGYIIFAKEEFRALRLRNQNATRLEMLRSAVQRWQSLSSEGRDFYRMKAQEINEI